MENIITKLGFCRLCRSTKIRFLFRKYGYEVAVCRSCGFIFLNFSPSQSFLKKYYSEDFFKDPGTKHGFSDYEGEVRNLRKTFWARIQVLRNYRPGGSLLDVGCATGTFMEAAAPFWEVSGVEISDYASRMAQGKGLKVFQGSLENSPYVDLKFDVVTLWDTLEHLAEPRQTIERLGKMTSPGGIVALTTGDVKSLVARVSGRFWHLYNIPQHLSFFDPKSISDLFAGSGLKIREIGYPRLNFTLDYLFFRFVTFYKIGALDPFYRWLKEKKLLDWDIKLNLFDIMLVVAQKEAGPSRFGP